MMRNPSERLGAAPLAAITLFLHLFTAPVSSHAGPGYALSFNGTNQYVSATVPVLASNYTLSAWVNLRRGGNYGTSRVGLLTGSSGGNSGEFLIGSVTDNAADPQYLELGRFGAFSGQPSTNAVPLNQWAHVAITVSSNQLVSYFINGQAAGSWDASGLNVAVGPAIFLGSQNPTRHFEGLLDEVQIWNVARSQTEIQAGMNQTPNVADPNLTAYWPFDEGTGTTTTADASGHGHTGTLANAPAWNLSTAPISPDVADYALSFNGTNQYVSASAPALASNYTISAWVYLRGTGVGMLTGTNCGDSVEMLINPEWPLTGSDDVFLELGRCAGFGGHPSLHAVPSNQWRHVAITVSPSKRVSYFINGNAAGSWDASGLNLSFGSTIHLGDNTVRHFDGLLDEVQIWSVARSPAEIQAGMNHVPNVADPNLAAYWPFAEGAGTNTTADASGHGHTGTLVNAPAWNLSVVSLLPDATTGLATDLTPASANLNGTVNPGNWSTTVWFEWGTTTNYGNATAPTNLPALNANVAVSATLNGLTTGLTHHFRLVAENALGRVRGADQSWLNWREISLAGNGLVITNGQTQPAAADGTLFGAVVPGENPVTHTFTIRNLGGVSLHLTGSPLVAVSGPHAADFVVTLAPAATVAGYPGTTAFQVAFTPSAFGVRQATLSIGSDDNLRNPYQFNLQGLGGVTDFDSTSDRLGTITARGQYLDQTAAQAFDDSTASKWLDVSPEPLLATWIQYEYATGRSYSLSSYTLTSADDVPARDPAAWVLEGSNDGTNYVSVDSQSGQSFSGRLTKKTYVLSLTAPYHLYRLRILSVLDPGSAGSCQIGEIELIGSTGGAPWFAQSPVTLYVLPGMPASFTVGGDGSRPINRQWYRHPGTYLAGQTNTTLAWASVTTNDFGGYFAVLSNAFGSTTSSVAYLFPPALPVITRQPQGLIVRAGAAAEFQVSVSGPAPFAYQWQKEGVNLADGGNRLGTGSPQLTLSAVTTSDGGSYAVIVTNLYGSVTSSVARLAVAPWGDPADNLVVNGGFETGDFSGWVNWSSEFQVVSQGRHSGSYSAAGNSAAIRQFLPTQPGTTYLITSWISCDGWGSSCQVFWDYSEVANRSDLPAAWQQVRATVEATSTLTELELRAECMILGPFIIDDVSVVPLPNLRPTLQTAPLTSGGLQFSWPALDTVPPVSYQVQTSTNLTSTNWLDVGGLIPGGTGTLSVTNPVGTDPQRFYRLQLVP